MTRLTFEAEDEKGNPRVFAGMWRSPEAPSLPGYVMCTCGSILQTVQAVRDHWQQGHFDRPLYQDSEAT